MDNVFHVKHRVSNAHILRLFEDCPCLIGIERNHYERSRKVFGSDEEGEQACPPGIPQERPEEL